MITDEELRIANTSYLNKDFVSIYPELLDLAKKISPKWDPSLTNESDPGLVLLKLLAFIGDKVNYNTDRNILEAFLPSASQETSVRDICEREGYSPKYYRSAQVNVAFRYDGNKDLTTNDLTFPAFDTVVTDEPGEVSYSLIKPVTIEQSKSYAFGAALQGKFENLIVGNKDKIQLSDLDDNNRVYFPEPMVAENGVFIYTNDLSGDPWEQTTNLNLIEPVVTNKFFKFGFDSSKGLPYVEFPVNIADMIDSGLIIKYLVTSGANGSISANTLTALKSPQSLPVDSDSPSFIFSQTQESESDNEEDLDIILINNFSASTAGSDPETIDEAYNSFKKTIGTFDTLVTCRDYSNYIYNLLDDTTGLYYVSNVQVADRRNDVNYGNNIITYALLGKQVESFTSLDDITPYDLCLYPLKPFGNSYTVDSYVYSFKPIYKSDSDLAYIKRELEDSKTISHDYKSLNDNDIYAIKNYYAINPIISTTYKVNAFEQEAIKNNVIVALIKAFNGRKVDYGYEIPFDSILEVIEKADPRIKNVALEEPVVRPVILKANGNEAGVYDGGTVRTNYIQTLAKNILAGRLELFDYDRDFSFEFGQSDSGIKGKLDADPSVEIAGPVFKHLYKIDTEVTIPEASYGQEGGYTLGKNESVQIIAPNLSTEIVYPAYTYFSWTGPVVPANSEYCLTTNDELKIQYTDSKSVIHDIILSDHTVTEITNGIPQVETRDFVIIKPNFDLKAVVGTVSDYDNSRTAVYEANGGRSTYKITFNGTEILMFSLSTNEEIARRNLVTRIIDDSALNCYWKVNNQNNCLFNETDIKISGHNCSVEKLLGDNEYFAYTDSSKTELIILGSGTTLILNWNDADYNFNPADWTLYNKVLLSEITDKGLSVFEDFNWKQVSFIKKPLTVMEMQIITLTEGDSFTIQSETSGDSFGDVDNTFKVLTGFNVLYKLSSDDSFSPLTNLDVGSYAWRIRSKLNLNCGPNNIQVITALQKVTLYCYESVSFADPDASIQTGSNPYKVEIIGSNYSGSGDGYSLGLSEAVQLAGGNGLDVSTTIIETTGIKTTFDLSSYVFDYTTPYYEISIQGMVPVKEYINTSDEYIQVPVSQLDEVDTLAGASFDLPVMHIPGEKQLIMFYVSTSEQSTMQIKLSVESGTLSLYNSGIIPSAELVLRDPTESGAYLDSKLFIVETSNAVTKITVSCHRDSGDIYTTELVIGALSNIKGFNPVFGLQSTEEQPLLDKIAEIDTGNNFFYNYPADKASLIDIDDTTSPYYFWDKNNIYNRITIGEIDFGNSKISIAKSSRV